MIVKNLRRKQISERYKEKRLELKKILKDLNISNEEKRVARINLEKMPRDSNPNRIRNRCWATGKPRGVYRDFGLCRNQLRARAHNGELPGVVKSSW